jgi:hypothetical protein
MSQSQGGQAGRWAATVPRSPHGAGPARGRTIGSRSRSGSLSERYPMSDKSPRQSMSKKSGKSIKEKRAEKRSKGSEETFSDKIHPTKKK